METKELLTPFLAQLGGNKSQRNRELYQQRLNLFLELYGEIPIQEITCDHVFSWLNTLKQRGYASATMAGYRQALKTFFNFCVRGGWIVASPAAGLQTGSFHSKRNKLPAEKDIQKAYQTAIEWMHDNDPLKIRDGVICMLSYTCGPRSKEIRNLKLSSIKQALRAGANKQGVYTTSSDGKTGETVVRFGELVANGLRRWLSVRPNTPIDICFVTIVAKMTKTDRTRRYRPLSRSGLNNVYCRICAAAGIPTIYSHAMRHRVGHTTATQHGAKIAAIILNHKDWETARTAIAYYTHPNEDDVSAAIRAIESCTPNETKELNRLFTGF